MIDINDPEIRELHRLFMREVGRLGGESRSLKKANSSRKNLQKANAVLRAKKRESRSDAPETPSSRD